MANDFAKQLLAALRKKTDRAISKTMTQAYAEEIKDDLVKRTKLGNGFDPATENTIKLPKLSDNYKEMRQGKSRWFTTKDGKRIKVKKGKNNTDFVKKPKLSNTTTPAKSNITATGQLLRSLSVVKIKKKAGAIFKIVIGDNRGRGLFGYPSTIGNKELVKILAAKGFTWFGFTKSQTNKITRETEKRLKKNLIDN